MKLESIDQVWSPRSEDRTMSRLNGPDFFIPPPGWFDHGLGNNQAIMTTDAMATLLSNNDLATSASSQAWDFGSGPWNNMPAVCQMSDRHP